MLFSDIFYYVVSIKVKDKKEVNLFDFQNIRSVGKNL